MKKVEIEFIMNGKKKSLSVKPNDLLINIIRNDLFLTGSKYGCGIGECGACTVLINVEPFISFLTLAATVDGKEITTIEGLATEEGLHPLQEAFIKHFAVQCGYCTPGMILKAKALLDESPDATEDEIRVGLSGNLCRCTGYVKIVEAIMVAQEEMKQAISGKKA